MRFRSTLLLTVLLFTGVSVPYEGMADFGLTTTTDYYQVDTGAGLVFKIRRVDLGVSTQSPGDIRSLVYNGVEYQDQARGSQINAGFDWVYDFTSDVSVSAQVVDPDHIKVTVVAGDLTHYYMAQRGDAKIYMATYFTSEPQLGHVRYIVRIPHSLLPNGSEPAELGGTDYTVESGDIFGFSPSNSIVSLRGQTRSKHYSNMRLNNWSYFGATGPGVGAWMVRDNHEGGSGGPFYRSLLQQGSGDQELTYIVNYGEVQTEAFRTHILNHYTLVFTDGSEPGPVDTSWFDGMGLLGYVPLSGRGSVSCSGISGCDTNYAYTAGLANTNAQFWAQASSFDGSFSITNVLPGTYDFTLYKNEMAVYTDSVTVSAENDTAMDPIAIKNDPSTKIPVWRIGDWDGTPAELLNGDRITTMHPSDVRISDWDTGTYVVGSSSPETDMPCYQWKEIAGGSKTIQFTLTEDQIVDSILRIGITVAYSGGRPDFDLNGWDDGVYTAASSQPSTRSLTVGSYRGNNTIYTFSIPASALQVGVNTLNIYPISGSGLSGYLSAGYSLDCIDFYEPSAQPVEPELIALYSFEGDANDSSGNNNNASTTGSPAYTTGQEGQAIDLDGTDDVVTLPAGVADSHDITIATWVKWDGGGAWQRIFDFGNNTAQYMFLSPSSGDGTLRFAIKNGGSEQRVETSQLAIGQWVHLAVKLEDDTATLYVNGSPVDTNTTVTINPSDFSPAINYIGKSQWPDPLLNGSIDEFRIYSYALDDATIAAIANGDDVTPPDAPTALTATAGDSSVSLDWADNAESDLDSYTVYRSITSGSGYHAIASNLTSSSYDDNNVTNNMTYFYVVTATDTSTNESAYSSQTSATPTPSIIPPNITVTIDAGTLNLSWPSNNTGWRLLYSTNLLSGTWQEVPNSDTNHVYEVQLNALPTSGMYYKLAYP